MRATRSPFPRRTPAARPRASSARARRSPSSCTTRRCSRDPALVAAVASATRLSASNVALRAEVRAQAQELVASRRRLLVAADDERRRLEARLREGAAATAGRPRPAPRAPRRTATSASSAHGSSSPARSTTSRSSRAACTRASSCEAGLPGALASLAERAPVPVELDVGVGRLPAELEATVYFVCAEALANVAKYASASTRADRGDRERRPRARRGRRRRRRRRRRIARHRPAGPRRPRRGGRRHVSRVTSPPGGGTRLAAEIPLGGEAR